MQEFNNLSYTTSEQHKESTGARIQRDLSDLEKIKEKLTSCTPFSSDSSLRNIVNGIVAEADVNVHQYESIGRSIIDKMIGQSAFTFSFKRKDKAKTLGDMATIKITSERTIDPALLFQRLLVVSQTGDTSLEEVMGYELSPFPTALFEAKNTFRKADKPSLAHAIHDHSNQVSDEVPITENYVIDGGSLLHRLP